MTYDPDEYWKRLHRRSGLSAVGQSGQPVSMNRWLYATLAREVECVVAASDVRPDSVLDVGAGTGFWMEFWQHRGATKVHGVDFQPAAVDVINERFPGSTRVLDIGAASPGAVYDLVSVMNVLLHITDDARFDQALRHVAGAVLRAAIS